MKHKKLHGRQKERISTDMYLKTILEYEMKFNKKPKPVDIVRALNLTKGSVSEMIKKLEEEGYIKYESYGIIELTKEGLQRAKNVERKYMVIKRFLEDILKIDPSKTGDEACNLEHAFSDESVAKLNILLKIWEKNKSD